MLHQRVTVDRLIWAAVLSLLILSVSGVVGYAPVMVVVLLDAARYWKRDRHVRSFSSQVRTAYLLLLVIGLWPPLQFIHWLQIAGTLALVIFDYCPLARTLSLMPWNRQQSLSMSLVKRTFFSRPVAGSFLESSVARGDQ